MAGTSTLGLAVLVERGATFAANILAARFAGASAFGAYSVGISTANNISTYAAGGIGATATRFSGKYPYGSGTYCYLRQGTHGRVLDLRGRGGSPCWSWALGLLRTYCTKIASPGCCAGRRFPQSAC